MDGFLTAEEARTVYEANKDVAWRTEVEEVLKCVLDLSKNGKRIYKVGLSYLTSYEKLKQLGYNVRSVADRPFMALDVVEITW